MICTNTPEASPAVGCILEQEQMAWDWADWADQWPDDVTGTYERSVIWAADGEGLLSSGDLLRLLAAHGFAIPTLSADLEAAAAAGHPVANLRHAGQALVWLGY
jgi:hypothetical protein